MYDIDQNIDACSGGLKGDPVRCAPPGFNKPVLIITKPLTVITPKHG